MFFSRQNTPKSDYFSSCDMVLSSLISLILFVYLPFKKWCYLVIQQLWFLLIWCDINKKLPNFVYNICIY